MKKLNPIEQKQISGGEKFLLVTSSGIDLEDVPVKCREVFLNYINNISLVGLTPNDLNTALLQNCSGINPEEIDLFPSTSCAIIEA